jgi:hypothetical protein
MKRRQPSFFSSDSWILDFAFLLASLARFLYDERALASSVGSLSGQATHPV